MEKRKFQNTSNALPYLSIVCLFASLILMAYFLMHGETKISGAWPDPDVTDFIVCFQDDIQYNIYDTGKDESSTTRVNMIFEEGVISSMSLIREMYFMNEDLAKSSMQLLNFEINRSMELNGLGFGALNANFVTNNVVGRMSIYATHDIITETTIKYFMLDKVPNNKYEYIEYYKNKGFACDEADDR